MYAYGPDRDDDHEVELELMMRTDDDCDVMPDWYYAAPDFEDAPTDLESRLDHLFWMADREKAGLPPF